MTYSYYSRFKAFILALSLIVILIPQGTFASSEKAVVTVTVKDGDGADAKNISGVYVVMYNVSVVDNEWWGKKAQVKKVPAGKKSVNFGVKAGQVVDFAVFESTVDVKNNKKRQFYAPPFKNFGATDPGKICYVAGVDFSKKLPDVPGCVSELELIYSGKSAKVSVAVNDGSESEKPISGVFVGMYRVTIVDSMWSGELLQVKPIPAGKKSALFSIAPGQIVDFVAFTSADEAKKHQKHQFTVPPHKNFSGTYDDNGKAQDGFCLIVGVDIGKKLDLGNGTYSCGTELGLTLQK